VELKVTFGSRAFEIVMERSCGSCEMLMAMHLTDEYCSAACRYQGAIRVRGVIVMLLWRKEGGIGD